jgi:hypothetical protein
MKAEFYCIICFAVCGLMFFCGLGATAYGASRCMTEVLDKETTVFAITNDLKLRLHLKKGKDKISISNPKDVLNDEGALIENFPYQLSSEKFTEECEIKKPLVVQAEDGKRYLVAPETQVQLAPPSGNLPDTAFTAIIPAGKKLIKQELAAIEEYKLAEDQTVNVTFRKNSQVTLKLYPKTRVERMSDPIDSNIGTTLTVVPKKAPLGGYIILTVKNTDFEFAKAQFHVCLRLHVKDEEDRKEFFASDDVELQKAGPDMAILRIRIPEKLDGLGGLYFAKPVDLLVVADDKNGGEVKRVEAITQEFSVSSRPLAVLIWILAFLVPWLITAFITGYMWKSDRITAIEKNMIITKERRDEAIKKQDTNRINELRKKIEKQKDALSNAKATTAWAKKFNPILIISSKVGGASLSLAQILLWSILVFSASFYVLVVSGKLLDLTDDVLILLGIAGGASLIAKITVSVKDGKGQALVGETEKVPKWLDVIKTDGRPDLYKLQMALFTTLAAVFVTQEIYSTMVFPILPAGLLTLIGISNGVYLSAKASTKTAFEELAEIDRERQKATENLEKLKTEASKLDELLKNAEDAETNLGAIEGKSVAINKSGTADEIAEHNRKIEELVIAKKKAIDDKTIATNNKDKAVAAMKEAEDILKKLQADFEAKKIKALQ